MVNSIITYTPSMHSQPPKSPLSGQMVWGSGIPDIVDAHLTEYTEADRRKVKGENLARLLDWD